MTTNYSLAAKITRPITSGTVTRNRLLALLDDGGNLPLTWISSPAGSGKTTLAADYLDERKIPCLWYQCDEGDADVATFFYYLGLAAKKAAPRNRTAMPLLTPEYLQGFAVFARRFFEKLYSRLKPPFILVFDNYQAVSPESLIHEAVNIAISALPGGARVFVLSRSEPPAALARLRANGAMLTAGWDELRFTREEAKELVPLKAKRALTEVAVERLYRKTEGWAAGLVLIAKGAGTQPRDSASSAHPAQSEIFHYFAEEVFGKLDSATRDFLLMTAFLPAMTARMAESMTDQEDAGRILARLTRNHFFTERHQTAEPSYQYHPLFREFLTARMKGSLNAAGLLRVQARAAAVMAAAGRIEDAAALYREANNWENYIPLILGHAQTLVMQGRSATLSEWLAAVPRELRETVPWLQYWTGACMLPVNPLESRDHFERAFERFRKADDVPGQFLAWAGVADSIFFAGFDYAMLDPWFDILDELLRRHPDFPSLELEALVSNSVFGALLYRRPEQARLVFWEPRLARLIPTLPDDRLRIALGSFLLNYYTWIGDVAKATRLMETLRATSRAHEVSPLALLLLNNIEAAHCWNTVADFEGCHEIVAKALKTAELTGVRLLDPLLISQGVYGALSAGDASRGAGLLGRITPAPGLARRFDAAHYYYLAGWEAALRDELPRALELAQISLSLTESAGLPFPQALNHIAMALALILLKKFPEASDRIVSARLINHAVKSDCLEFMCLFLEADSALEQNDEEKCLSLLRAAFALGKDRSFVNFPWWLPRVMSRLCARALEAGIEVEYVKGLIRKRKLPPPGLTAEAIRRSASLNPQLDNWPWPLRINTLGRFELIIDGEPARFTGKVQQKPLALLKALIALGGRDIAEERLTDLLWPEADGDLAHKSFEMTVQRLRRLINIDKVVQLQERRLSLAKGLCWVDVRELEGLIEKTDAAWQNGHPSGEASPEAVLLSEKALALYKGHFLPADSAQAWVLTYRERMRSKFLRLVSRLGLHHERALRWEKAAEVYRKGLEVDDHAEEFYQQLMVCYERLGREAEAIAVYKRCHAILSSSIGMPPSWKTEELYQSIRNKL
jgi:DNA-binding SARP family transcriptional activator